MQKFLPKTFHVPLTVACALAATAPAFAQSNADILKEIQTLKSRLQELEKIVAQPPGTTVTVQSSPAGAPSLKPDESGFMKWNEFVTGKSRFKLYGFLRADAIYDDSRPGGNTANSSLVPAYILSEDGRGGAANLAPGKDHENFVIHPRLTRFGIDFTGPEVPALWGAKTGGKLEIDFYNLVANSAESREFLRMRHAYLGLKWDQVSFLAGQTSDLISQYFPAVNPDFVMWGAGNVGDRRPQFRLEYSPQIGEGTAFFQSMAGLTGADDNRDLDTNSIRDGESSGVPTLQGRAGYRFPLCEKQNAELAVWGHYAREKIDAGVGPALNKDFTSEAVGLDFSTPILRDLLLFKGELWMGRNLDDIRGGILQGINIASGRTIRAEGGWGELTFKPNKWYSLHLGYTIDNPRDSDLPAQAPARNNIAYLANRLYLEPIEIGLDYLNWTTYFKDPAGRGKGQDNRFQAYVSYKF